MFIAYNLMRERIKCNTQMCIVFFMRQRIIFSNAPALAANQAGVLPTLPGVPRPAFFEEKK